MYVNIEIRVNQKVMGRCLCITPLLLGVLQGQVDVGSGYIRNDTELIFRSRDLEVPVRAILAILMPPGKDINHANGMDLQHVWDWNC